MARDMEIHTLNQRLAIDDRARFAPGTNSLPKLVVNTPLAEAEIYLHGAHVTHFRPADSDPLLYLSPISRFEHDRAIRGGIPICFPWFGQAPAPTATERDNTMPAHGFVRRLDWRMLDLQALPDGRIRATLGFEHQPSDAYPSPPFRLVYTVTVGEALDLNLEIHNPIDAPLACELALHTHFAVQDIRRVQLLGLENTDYLDKTTGFARRTQPQAPVVFTAETDRIYLDTTSDYRLVDVPGRRHILIRKTGSNSTIVWTPWVDKARALDDLTTDDWPHMLCVETGNVADNAMYIPPRQAHTLTTTLSTEPI